MSHEDPAEGTLGPWPEHEGRELSAEEQRELDALRERWEESEYPHLLDRGQVFADEGYVPVDELLNGTRSMEMLGMALVFCAMGVVWFCVGFAFGAWLS